MTEIGPMISQQMVKRQQIQWAERGPRLLLRLRVKVLNDGMDQTFRKRSQGFRTNNATRQAA